MIRADAALAAQIRAFCRAACLYGKQLGGTLYLLMLHVYLRDAGGKDEGICFARRDTVRKARRYQPAIDRAVWARLTDV
jgi:hypothetical protein